MNAAQISFAWIIALTAHGALACSPEPKVDDSGVSNYLECHCKSTDVSRIAEAMKAFPVKVSAGMPAGSTQFPGYGQCGFILEWSERPQPVEKCKEIKNQVMQTEDRVNSVRQGNQPMAMNASSLICF